MSPRVSRTAQNNLCTCVHLSYVTRTESSSDAEVQNFAMRWNVTAVGWPHHQSGQVVLETILSLIQAGKCQPFPDGFITEFTSLMPDSTPEKLYEDLLENIDMCVAEEDPAIETINGRDRAKNKRLSLADIAQAIRLDTSKPLSEKKPYGGCFGVPMSPDLFDVHPFRLPKTITEYSTLDIIPGCDIQISTTATPAGWTTYPHHDYDGAMTFLVHVKGVKLWLMFERTPYNARVMDDIYFDPNDIPFTTTLKRVEGIYCMIAETPVCFGMNPFEYHACLSLTASFHVGGPAYRSDDVSRSVKEINIMIDHLLERKDSTQDMATSLRDRLREPIQLLRQAADKIKSTEDRRATNLELDRLKDRVHMLRSLWKKSQLGSDTT
jgi:hypothetical protein